MAYRDSNELVDEVVRRRMRRAIFVTALPIEMAAVRAHLVDMGSVAGRDGAIYECGSFSDMGQQWFVVVAETGAGTHPALSVVTNAHVLLRPFEVQIFVGVGGSRKHDDAPLGSVIASSQVYMPYSGKYGDSGFSSRPRGFPIDSKLRGIAQKVCRDATWPARIRDPRGGTLPPRENYPFQMPPHALVAPIASIEAVLADKSSELEALLAQHYGDACVVEMEGYGALYAASNENVPSIVVRGVSDLAENKEAATDALRQPVAACHAAGFAFEVLSHWGQVYSSPERLAPPTIVPPAAASLDTHVAPQVPQDAQNAHIALNFNEPTPVDLDARLKAIETLLREVLKSDAITVTGGEIGSLHVFVFDPHGAIESWGDEELKAAILKQGGPELLGIANVDELPKLKAFSKELTRASNDLMNWPNSLPDGEQIERPEFTQLVERIRANTFSTTVVLGSPGAGKSALLANIARWFSNENWPVLAIKSDLLDADLGSELDLQLRLSLEEKPSSIVQRLARFQPVLLILDQLDALAGYLDIRTARLSVLLGMVRRLGGQDNVHIVLSSREFEFQHDVRLKAVSAESITLQLPSWSQVTTILAAHGVDASHWPEDAQEVMRSPQAIATYLRLRDQHSEPYRSYQSMLDSLWDERVLRGPGGSRRASVATEVAEQMASEESLWLAAARFEEYGDEIAALKAAGVLNSLGGSLGFAHQTLFDYALARNFARGKGRLSGYVLERQTSLFLRPKLWAGLTYLRAVDRSTYHHEIESVWHSNSLRPHLRRLLIDFLGQQREPTDREALLLEDAFRNTHLRPASYRALAGSSGWFSRFARSFISEGMRDPADADQTIQVLSQAWAFAPETVVELLNEHWLPRTEHDFRTWVVLGNATNWTDDVMNIACAIARRAPIAEHAIDHVLGTIGVEQPLAALQLARARLDFDLARAIASSEALAQNREPEPLDASGKFKWSFDTDPRRPLRDLVDRNAGWESLSALAEKAWSQFFDVLWPWYESYFFALAERSPEPRLSYPLPYEADFRFDVEDHQDLPERPLLAALRLSAERFAEAEPALWSGWCEKLSAIALMPAQRLIAHTFSCNPSRFADSALAFLLTDRRRLVLGSISDLTGTSKRLVSTTSPFWTARQVEEFEAFVKAYSPPASSDLEDATERRNWTRHLRRIRLDLLRALPKHKRTSTTQRHVEEEERVFPIEPMGARFSGAQYVGSMMSVNDITRASDDDVVNAFVSIPDASGWDHPQKWMVGGNIQLSREFATFAAQNPERAVRILNRLDAKNGTRATAYAIEAMAEAAPPDVIFDLYRQAMAKGMDGEEFRGSVSRAVEKLLPRETAIPNDLVAALEAWVRTPQATLTPNDAREQPDIDFGDRDKHSEVEQGLLWDYGGISILPNGDYPVLEALVRLRMAQKQYGHLDSILRQYLETSQDVRVWEHLLYWLKNIHFDAPGPRAEFLRHLLEKVPDLVGTRSGAETLANAHWWDSDFADSQLDKWRVSARPIARRGYGEIVAVVAIIKPTIGWAQSRIEALIDDEELKDAKIGAAYSAAHLWGNEEYRTRSNALLLRLLPRGEPGVWKATFDIFRIVDELTPDSITASLLSAILEHLSEAPALPSDFVVERLSALLPHQATLVAQLTQKLVEHWGRDLGDLRTSTAIASQSLIDLAVTLHRLGPETREIGTALFERLIELDAWQARQTLDEIDHRFPTRGIPSRARLPRRQTRQRRRRLH